MSALDRIVEERIRAAAERGELRGLPGEGKPLPEEDLALIPEEMRLAIRVLKNAGIAPPAVAQLKELRGLVKILVSEPAEEDRSRALGRLHVLVARLEAAGLARSSHAVLSEYRDALLDRLVGDGRESGSAP